MNDVSQIYGIQKEHITNLITEGAQRSLTLCFIKSNPKAVYVSGLRKVKARGMVEALINTEYVNGNHTIRFAHNVFGFYYRGTLIYSWDALTNEGISQPAGEFEHTASTQNQRREIQKSITNFNECVFTL